MNEAERNAKKIEKILKPGSESEKEPVIVKVFKMYADDEVISTYLVEGEELSAGEFYQRYPDWEPDDDITVSVNWDDDETD